MSHKVAFTAASARKADVTFSAARRVPAEGLGEALGAEEVARLPRAAGGRPGVPASVRREGSSRSAGAGKASRDAGP